MRKIDKTLGKINTENSPVHWAQFLGNLFIYLFFLRALVLFSYSEAF